jgi:pyridoxamine 5'-phosphate oxidase
MKLDDDPIAQYHAWQREARGPIAGDSLGRRLRWRLSRWFRRLVVWLLGGDDLPEANAAALATADAGGRPSARMVLVKQASADGFVFYTNYGSRKAAELAANPRAALVLYWAYPPRQIRVEGAVERLDPAASAAYFHSRPRGSQIGARASRQSQPLGSRGELEARFAELEARYRGREVPWPEFWGGYRLVPERIEFWQGRVDRLHDRVLYRRDPAGGWQQTLLQP